MTDTDLMPISDLAHRLGVSHIWLASLIERHGIPMSRAPQAQRLVSRAAVEGVLADLASGQRDD